MSARRVYPELNRRGFAQIMVVAVIALVLGAIVIFGYQKYLKKSPIVDQKTEAQASPLASADETANWKTYTNQKNGYLLKYPSNWFIIPPDQYSPDEFSSCNRNTNIYCEREKNQISVKISAFDSNESPQSYYSRYSKGVSNITPSKTETLSSEVGVRFSIISTGQTDPEGVQFIGDKVVVKHNSKLYILEFTINAGAKSDNLEEARNIFNQILSTFKFL